MVETWHLLPAYLFTHRHRRLAVDQLVELPIHVRAD